MTTLAGRSAWFPWWRRGSTRSEPAAPEPSLPAPGPELDIALNDPLLTFLASVAGAVDVDSIALDSPALGQLRKAGVKLIVPLVSQGELIGMLNLGPRLSQQAFSADDRRLLTNLAAHAAPAVRVAQLVREQQAEARERERIAQELRVAQLIQQQFLPRRLPDLPGWQLAAHYQPAREVGGDFYDFIDLPSGELGVVVGDVTDKGVPAALVMASTRSILRTEALRTNSPGQVLQRVNDLLCPDIPDRMFVTCLYAVLDPATGRFRYANAGHNLPYVRSGGTVLELRATGMPLGLLPGMTYEEQEANLKGGDRLLLYSDGLVEAHNGTSDMFGFPRVMGLLGAAPESRDTIDALLSELARFTGQDHEQEDDITLVTLVRAVEPAGQAAKAASLPACKTLAAFEIPSIAGNERLAIEHVAQAVSDLPIDKDAVERLGTAVSEGVMNAIEHGNRNDPDLPVAVSVVLDEHELIVRIVDRGTRLVPEAPTPDLDLKLAGLQPPRGWGLFLIRNMVDDLRQQSDDKTHTLELVVHLNEGGSHNGNRSL